MMSVGTSTRRIFLFLVFLITIVPFCFADVGAGPGWVKECPKDKVFVFEVGTSCLSTFANAKKEAVANARASLCKRVVDSLVNVFDLVLRDDEYNDVVGRFSVEFYHFVFSKVKVEELYKDADEKVFVLVSISKSDLIDQYKAMLQKYQDEYMEKKLETERRLNDLIDRIDCSTETDDLVMLKNYAVSKAVELTISYERGINLFKNKGLVSGFKKEMTRL